MNNGSKLWTQIAAEAGCTPNKAKVAAYLSDLAENGTPLARAAELLKRKTDYVKRYSREFLIDFPDYRPFERAEKAGKKRPEPKITLRVSA